MVHFMYHGKYDADHVLPSAKSEGGCEMLLHVRVVGVAQKYFIEPLQKFAGGLAAELMKAWDGKSSIFAESMLAIYTCTEDVAFGTMLRERAVEVAMDNALLLFGEGNDHLSSTRELFFDETPGFMEDWARAMSYCNDTLSTANINLEVMNDVLNDDNVKLDDRHKKLKDAFDQLKAAAKEVEQTSLKVSKDYSDLINQYDDLYSKTKDLVSIPDRPTENDSYVPSGPAPDCYMCPNCEVLFFKAMRSYSNYHQNCFENGWCGKLGKGGVQMSYGEWQAHLVRKA
jgi:hypothetical protein